MGTTNKLRKKKHRQNTTQNVKGAAEDQHTRSKRQNDHSTRASGWKRSMGERVQAHGRQQEMRTCKVHEPKQIWHIQKFANDCGPCSVVRERRHPCLKRNKAHGYQQKATVNESISRKGFTRGQRSEQLWIHRIKLQRPC